MPNSIDTLVQQLSDGGREERRAAREALVGLGSEAVDQLLPLLRDGRSSAVATDATRVVRRMGDAAAGRLVEIRRQGPGELRAAALRCLAELSGGRDFAAADRRALERLVRIKLLAEHSFTLPAGGRWLAFPADRLDDVVAALGLHGLTAATGVLGIAAATQATDAVTVPAADGHPGTSGGRPDTADGGPDTAYRVFISPQLKQWRLLYGNSFIDDLGGHELAEKASARCGEAHFYSIDPYQKADVWWVAREGHVVRGYATYGEPEWVGDPLPFESEFIDMDEDDLLYDAYFAEKYADGVTDAHKAAEELSVEPGPVRPRDLGGHGWLAGTHPDVPPAHFPGALRI